MNHVWIFVLIARCVFSTGESLLFDEPGSSPVVQAASRPANADILKLRCLRPGGDPRGKTPGNIITRSVSEGFTVTLRKTQSLAHAAGWDRHKIANSKC